MRTSAVAIYVVSTDGSPPRRVGSPAEVRRCFEEAFAALKPTDAVIVGMYQQFGDQVGEDAALVREIASRH